MENLRRSVSQSETASGTERKASIRSEPSTAGVCARRVVAALCERHIEPGPFLVRFGLENLDLADRRVRVPAAAEARLVEYAAEAIGERAFGLELAVTGRFDQAGVLYYLLGAASTIEETVRLMPRNTPAANESARWDVTRNAANGATLGLRYVGLLRRNLKHLTEFHLAASVQHLRDCTDQNFNPARVSFQHVRQTEIRRFERFFQCPVQFGSDADQIILSHETLDLPSRRADGALFHILERLIEAEIKSHRVMARPFREAVDNEMFRVMKRGEPSIDAVASALAVTARTLSRRLAEEGTSFSELLASVRHSLALQYLKEPGLSIDQIALLLGYGESASFSHAFKRWTGLSPSAAQPSLETSGV